MRRHDDPIVICPYNSSHKMPSARLQWHYAKCKDKALRQQQGLPTFNCKFNYSHVFLEQSLLDHHQEVCPDLQKLSRQLEVEETYRLNKSTPVILDSTSLEEADETPSSQLAESPDSALFSTAEETKLDVTCVEFPCD